MLRQTLTLRGRGPAAVSAILFCWLVLNHSTLAFAEKRRDHWDRQSRITAAGRSCRTASIQNGRDRYYQGYRSDNWRRNYAQSRAYDRDWDNNRYWGYDRERSKTKSALIIAGSTGAGAAVGAIAGGNKGAAIGAIAGGVAGLIYDRHTDNRR